MLAEVRPLRLNGDPLPRAQVRAAVPARGDLSVFKRHDPWRQCWVPVASLVADDGTTYVLPPLDQVRIAKWQGADLLLVGLEEDRFAKQAPPQLQAWWVQLVTDPAPPRTSRPDSGG
jgi:hypothetical protein